MSETNIINFFYFAVNRFFMKLLKTDNIDIVKYSQDLFGFKLPTELIPNRTAKFLLQASTVGTCCSVIQIVNVGFLAMTEKLEIL